MSETTVDPAPQAVDTTPSKPRVPPRVPLRSRIDWSWRHGPVIAPIQAGIGAFNAAAVGYLTHVNPLWAASTGIGMSIAAAIAARRKHLSTGGIFYWVACWAGAGTWATWAMSTTPWTGDAVYTLAAGTAAAGLLAPWVSRHEQQAVIDRAEKQAARARIEVAVEWEDRLARVAQVKWTEGRSANPNNPNAEGVTGIETWPREMGMTLQVQLPPGDSYDRLRPFTSQMAADAKIPLSCDVEILPGRDRSVAIIRVETVDVSDAEIPYPEGTDGTAPLTITQPLVAAVQRGGVDYPISVLDDPMLIVGQRGSGKTNAVQVMNALLLRCADTVVWHIDLNGSGMSRPWMTPWLKGQIREPVIDWVAATVDEAIVMMQAAINIAKARKTIYAEAMDAEDDDKLHPSPKVPEIVIVLDEGAEAMAMSRGNTILSAKIAELISIARAARVNLLLSTLRATGDIIPMEVQAQVGTKIFMRPVLDCQHEMAQLLGWSKLPLSEVAQPGTAAARTHDTAGITRVNFYRMRPSAIHAMAVAVAGIRPALDAPSAAAAVTGGRIPADAYTGRHARYRAWYADQGGTTITYTAEEDPVMPAHHDPDDAARDMAAAVDNMNKALADLAQVADEAERSGRQVADDIPGIDDRFAEITETLGDDASEDQKRRDWFATFLRDAQIRGDGTTPAEITARFEETGVTIPSRATINRWLTAAGWAPTGKGPDARWTPPA
jgi:S-DNA-T family DNA segregation ATPase FtsK/SpoIIIE